ncbi:hypothetical protein COK98_25880 [Bacillus cereus]|uniref:Uncharacterized protein n=1 Tax=Bacillus cereus TaxID=1396 RepID=A0A9X7G5H0_BACCE|nr:hypothetical protein CON26_15895 [Bacillus cereus]PFV02857.1 hypothetical protein COK98_25880 [Bacillus cereus]
MFFFSFILSAPNLLLWEPVLCVHKLVIKVELSIKLYRKPLKNENFLFFILILWKNIFLELFRDI